MELTIASIEERSDDVKVYALEPAARQALVPFAPGAHIDLHLPGGLIRQYSLLDQDEQPGYYRIAVKRVADGRGGSALIHEALRVGERLMVSPPRNNFPLDETASDYLFIAGGIGITPIWSMINRIESKGHNWNLHYAVRQRCDALFREELERFGDKVALYPSREAQPNRLDLETLLASAGPDVRIYCCGPTPMLQAFHELTRDRPADHARMEAFEALEQSDRSGGFAVELARSGMTLEVVEGKSILETLLEAGIDVPSSCRDGVCGTCETMVLAGTPDHRDVFLSPEEREAGDRIMVCCSGCLGDRLVLDL